MSVVNLPLAVRDWLRVQHVQMTDCIGARDAALTHFRTPPSGCAFNRDHTSLRRAEKAGQRKKEKAAEPLGLGEVTRPSFTLLHCLNTSIGFQVHVFLEIMFIKEDFEGWVLLDLICFKINKKNPPEGRILR